MSRPVKELILAEYERRFADVESALVVDIRGIDANDNNEFRLDLQKKDIRITILKNSLAKKAFAGTALEPLNELLEGPSAIAHGAESVVDVAREIVAWAKKLKDLDLKGVLLDGEFFPGAEGIKRVSKFPTRDEAQAQVVQLILSPARNILGAAKGPGGSIAGLIKTIQEKLEAGETISK